MIETTLVHEICNPLFSIYTSCAVKNMCGVRRQLDRLDRAVKNNNIAVNTQPLKEAALGGNCELTLEKVKQIEDVVKRLW